MKRVIIGADGATVDNVAALAGGSPPGMGTFLDVSDAMRVGPGAVWNKSTGAPAFAAAPTPAFGNPILFQCMALATDANGQLVVNWPVAFSDVPIPISAQILDPAGGVYAFTLLSNTANGLIYQVRKQRTLPAVVSLLGALAGYDTYQPAPAGMTCYVSAKLF